MPVLSQPQTKKKIAAVMGRINKFQTFAAPVEALKKERHWGRQQLLKEKFKPSYTEIRQKFFVGISSLFQI